TTYAYDNLNRLTGKTYSTGGGAPVTLCYDLAADCGGAAVPNSVGRLILASNDIGSTRYDGYDPMGRATDSTQTTSGQAAVSFHHAYDLAGNLTWTKYPSGREVQTDFDGAGRASKASNKQGTTLTPYANVGLFAPHGAIQTLKLGWNGTAEAMTESWNYNNRLQATQTELAATA